MILRYGYAPYGFFKKIGVPGPKPWPFIGTFLEYTKVRHVIGTVIWADTLLIMVLTDLIPLSLIFFLRASTILIQNAIRNMERRGGKCVCSYCLLLRKREYFKSTHFSYNPPFCDWVPTNVYFLHYKVVRWQAARVGHNGHSYD